ncbi:MAG TPA: hypothetical protein VGB92_06830 [Longimicrobium sp.]|jgi:hypothetical protein
MCKIRKLLLTGAGLLALSAHPAQAQLFFEDAEGRQLFLRYSPEHGDRINFGLNTKDKAITARILLFPDAVPSRWLHVFEARVRSQDGIGSLLANEQLNAGSGLAYTLGKMRVLTGSGDPSIDWGFVRVGYEAEKFDLFDPALPVAEQIHSETFRGVSVTGNYTLLISGAHLIGVTAGYERRHNGASLREVKIIDTEVIADGNPSRTIQRERTARTGEFRRENVVPIRVAWSRAPSESRATAAKLKLAPSIYGGILARSSASPVSAGVATYLTKADANGVRSSLGGVYLEARDVLDASGAGNGLRERVIGGIFINVPLFVRR